MSVKPIPEGYHTITPYLAVRGAAELLTFLKKAFDAEQLDTTTLPDGTIMNAEVRVGSSMLMVAETRSNDDPKPSMLYLYVEDADAVYASAVAAGGKSIMEPTDMFYGDRSGAVSGPSGNQWWIASRVEDVPKDEMQKRAAKAAAERA